MIIPIESRVVDFLELPGQGLAVAGLQHAAWRRKKRLGDMGFLYKTGAQRREWWNGMIHRNELISINGSYPY